MKRLFVYFLAIFLLTAFVVQAGQINNPGSSGGGGSGTVTSITAGSSNIVVTPSPLTTTGTIDLGAAITPATSVTTPLVIGGTTASSTLTLESTSGSGTTDAIIFKTASQSEKMRLQTGGGLGIGTTTNLNSALFDVNGISNFEKQSIGAPPVTVTISTLTFTPDISLGNIFSFTLAHSASNVMANPSAGIKAGATGILRIVQSSTGSDAISSWGSDYKFQGGVAPTLSTGANQIDMLSYAVIDSTHINVSLVGTNYQ